MYVFFPREDKKPLQREDVGEEGAVEVDHDAMKIHKNCLAPPGSSG